MKFRVSKGVAGHVAICPTCSREHQIDGLRALQKLKSFEVVEPKVPPIQFGIRRIMIATVLFALILGCAQYVGYEVVLAVFGSLALFGTVVLAVAFLLHSPGQIAGWFWDAVQRK